MKRAFLAVLVAAAYGFYSFHERDQEASLAVVPADEPAPGPAATVMPQPTPTPTPDAAPTPAPATPRPISGLRDGSYTGPAVDAFYGLVQVNAVISGGRLSDVVFLRYPTKEQHSRQVSQSSAPLLRQEAIAIQSASVDIVSGATDTSEAFIQSLGSALTQARS